MMGEVSCIQLDLDISSASVWTEQAAMNNCECLSWNITNGDDNDGIMNDLCVEKMLSAVSQNNDQTKRMTT